MVLEYFKAGLQKKTRLYFIPTKRECSNIYNIIYFASALFITLITLLSRRIDTCHLHVSQDGSFYRKLIIFLIAKAFRCKVIVQVHGSNFENFMTRNRVNRFFAKYMFNGADKVIVLSENWKCKIRDFAPKASTIKLFNPAPLPEKIGEKEGGKSLNILFLGRLSIRKGIYDLLRCVREDRQFYLQHKVKFVLAGDGDVVKARSFVDENHLNQFVEVPGWVSGCAKVNYLSQADIYVLPSYNEQMPMSILEAMAYGVPVVATSVAGIPELIEHGKNGLMIKAGDMEGLKAALRELISSREKRIAMGRASQKIVTEKFDSQQIISQLITIYSTLENPLKRQARSN